MAALSYVNDITQYERDVYNKMIHICSMYAGIFDITLNSIKTVCIKFGEHTRQ